MIGLKLYRDQAREIQQHFFPYLVMVCETKMNEADEVKDNDGKMVARMMLCLTVELQRKFDKKLLTDHNRFTIKMTDAEAICYYQLLMNFPLDPQWVYMVVLRQKITDFLHDELCL